ncbi:hypothetical protein GE061_001264 [Apolygus lucorum]|uniref:Uncharacterized protein n=1 Tax=Apolygus lucorum TaxID=248454 RepID=A0A8S9Y6V3_APOLU|nr:hypothetical protein GE061_001264 [Apolygus lucorum]
MAENNDRGENSEKKGERSKIGLIKVRTNLFATPPPPRHDIEDPSADVHADEAIASQEPQLESDIFGSYIDGSFGAVEEPDSGASSTSNMAEPVPVRQVPSCPTPEINVLVVSSSRYTSIGTRRANHMAFHPSTNEFAVVFPESLKFFRIESPKDKTVVKRVTSIPALPDALFKQVRLGPTGSDTLALTGSQLLRVGGGEIKPIFGNTMEVFNLFASDFVTYAAVGTMFGDVYVVELETGRLEFSVDVSDFQIRTIQLIGNFLFVVADNLMSVIDLTSETVYVVNLVSFA